MGRLIDITGKRFGRLVASKRIGVDGGGAAAWECLCDCGKRPIVSSTNLRSGHTRSCGCFYAERMRLINVTHGGSRTVEYRLWSDMVMRCSDVNNAAYGGRGIQVCKRWRAGENGKTGFECFLADMGLRPPGMNGKRPRYSLDRVNNDGNYESSNCRWATKEEQSYNCRTTVLVKVNGTAMSLNEAVRAAGGVIDAPRAAGRIRNGWDAYRAVSTPPFYRGERKRGGSR